MDHSENIYRSIFEHNMEAIFLTSPDGLIHAANPAACDLFGYSEEEICKLHRNTIVDINSPQLNDFLAERALSGRACAELILIRSDGSRFTAEVCSEQFFDELQNRRTIITVRDITERKKAERKLKEKEEQYRLLIAAMEEGVVLQDQDSKILAFNKSAERILGLNEDQLLGKSSFDPDWYAIHEDGSPFPGETHPVVMTLKTGEPQSNVIMGIHKPDRTLSWISVNVQPIFKEGNSTPYRVVATMHDITERKNVEIELMKYREHLEELVKERTIAFENSNKELESYSYTIAHDLRAPLRSIAGYSQIVLEDAGDKLNDLDKKHLRRILDSAIRMEQLIDDILELSRVTRTEVTFKEINLNDICSRIISILHALDENRNIEWNIQPGLVAYGDYDLLYLVLSNLLGNAWKFTQSRQQALIEFGAKEKSGEKVFYIRDNGVGFDMKYVDKLFGVFQRLHHQNEFAGTGIGLATVYRVIQRHNGWIKIEGEINEGTTVYFSLP